MAAYYSVYTEPWIFFNTHTHTNIYFQTWRAQDLLFLDTIMVIANRVDDLTIFNIVYDI